MVGTVMWAVIITQHDWCRASSKEGPTVVGFLRPGSSGTSRCPGPALEHLGGWEGPAAPGRVGCSTSWRVGGDWEVGAERTVQRRHQAAAARGLQAEGGPGRLARVTDRATTARCRSPCPWDTPHLPQGRASPPVATPHLGPWTAGQEAVWEDEDSAPPSPLGTPG